MARLPYVDPDTAPEVVAVRLRELLPLNIFRTVAHADDVFSPWLGFAGAVLNDIQLDPVLRQLAVLRLIALSPGADYVWVQHEGIAHALGMTETHLQAARTGEGLEGDEALILSLSEEIVLNVSPSDALWERAKARFSSRELVELLLVIGQYMMVCRIAVTIQLDIDEPQGMRGVENLRGA